MAQPPASPPADPAPRRSRPFFRTLQAPERRQRQRQRRAVGAALAALACAAGLGWWAGSSTQGGWLQALLARLPPPSHITAWLRQPDLSTLPGLPRHWNPWAPLMLQEPDGPFTRWKLDRLEAAPAACLQWLADTPDIASTPVPDRMAGSAGTAGQCGWQAASRINRMGEVRFSSPFMLTCGAAVALARWEHHVLQPAARAQLGAPVVRIEHLGSYACRRIAASTGPGQLSEHAGANALDVAAFTLSDGRRISVLGDWQSGAALPASTAKSVFLRQVRDGACDGFAAVLGPDYNAAHRDHFHFDRGPYRVCR